MSKTYSEEEGRKWTQEEIREACLKGDLSRQWYWHEQFRDATKNMYRTTTSDMLNFREVSCKSDMPSGYGGHVPKVKHDIFFENTGAYASLENRGVDSKRDCFPAFKQQKMGAPTFINTAIEGVTPSTGSLPDVSVQPPWAITPPIREVPSFKMTPDMNARSTHGKK